MRDETNTARIAETVWKTLEDMDIVFNTSELLGALHEVGINYPHTTDRVICINCEKLFSIRVHGTVCPYCEHDNTEKWEGDRR